MFSVLVWGPQLVVVGDHEGPALLNLAKPVPFCYLSLS